VQTYEYGAVSSQFPDCTSSCHQRNAALHGGTYALLLSDWFLRTLNALSQDGWTLALDDTQLQIFSELREKLQDILRAVKAIVAARKKGRVVASNADGMDAEWFNLRVCYYVVLTIWVPSPSKNYHFLRLDWLASPNKLVFSGGIRAKFDFLDWCCNLTYYLYSAAERWRARLSMPNEERAEPIEWGLRDTASEAQLSFCFSPTYLSLFTNCPLTSLFCSGSFTVTFTEQNFSTIILYWLILAHTYPFSPATVGSFPSPVTFWVFVTGRFLMHPYCIALSYFIID
jgi:hypothetical protein